MTDTPVTTRARPLRWRRSKSSGLRFSACSYELTRGGPVLATVQEIGDGRWFWYGFGINTASRPAELWECQDEAKRHAVQQEKADA